MIITDESTLTETRGYPGAPDRGGKKDDSDKYVELLKTLREKFKDSGRDLGITFTAPSSLWYLRWFDLPGMMEYADWVNPVRTTAHKSRCPHYVYFGNCQR